jgi:hypothetical protein
MSSSALRSVGGARPGGALGATQTLLVCVIVAVGAFETMWFGVVTDTGLAAADPSVVGWLVAHRGPGLVDAARGQALGEAGEAQARPEQLAGQGGRAAELLWAGVVGDALDGARGQRDVVRLAGMGLAVGIGEVRTLVGQLGQIGACGLSTICS